MLILVFLFVPFAEARESGRGKEMKSVEEMFEEELSEEDYFKADRLLVTATKRKISLRKAPAIAAVITADEIKNMGARYLSDVMKMIPGFQISINDMGRYMYEVRGIRTSTSEKLLVMMDGHRLNEAYTGAALSHLFNDLSIENIKQIEVIRGPGSALYGANAFVAVINIITKNAVDVDGVEAGIAGGSYDTRKINLQGGKSIDDFKAFGSVNYFDTDGAGLIIESDLVGGAPFSMTPGEADMSVEKTEAFLKLDYKDLSFKAHYAKKDRGAYIGFAGALTDENDYEHKNFWSELKYVANLTERFSSTFRAYYDYFEQDANLELFSEGFMGVYPDGAIGGPVLKDRIYGGEIQVDVDLFKGNHLIAGVNVEQIEQYDVAQSTNFDPLTFAPDEPYRLRPDQPFNKNVTRDIWAVYIQDEWAIMDNLGITAGMRYDNYDDFGDTANPRVGFVWNFVEAADLKLLYGQAFRAPSFVELYNQNNPGAIGNEKLDPETIKTYEIALGYKLKEMHTVNVNYFYNEIEDLIILDGSTAPAVFRNMWNAEVQGIEVVMAGKYSLSNYWQFTYTWQDAENSDTNEQLPDVPEHKVAFSVNYEFHKHLNAHADVLWIGERLRSTGDIRDDIDSYTTVDVSLLARNFVDGLEMQVTVFNLFDEDYEDPDMSGAAQTIYYDYPRQGTTCMAEIRYHF